jgi:uncharacterized MAPEG superfamily protein
MSPLLTLLVHMTVLTWLVLVLASVLRTRGWTFRGMRLAFGNRDDLDEPTALAGRAARTAANTLENLVLFAALVFVVHVSAPGSATALLGAKLFFWCRVAYVPAYLAGIKVLRTLIWMGSIAGLGAMVAAVV